MEERTGKRRRLDGTGMAPDGEQTTHTGGWALIGSERSDSHEPIRTMSPMSEAETAAEEEDGDGDIKCSSVESVHDGNCVRVSFILAGDGAQETAEEQYYSVTYRWSQRKTAWASWIAQNLNDKNVDLCEVNQLARVDLDLMDDDDDKSPLGQRLRSFEASLEERKKDIQRLKGEQVTLSHEIEILNVENRKLTSEKGAVSSHETNAEKSSATQRIAEKTQRIAEKTELITEKTQLIKKDATVVDAWIGSVLDKHRDLRNKFWFLSRKGNDSLVLTQTSNRPLDSERFDTSAQPSPGSFVASAPTTNDRFRDELIALVGKETKATLKLFQEFVSDLFDQATERTDKEATLNTTTAVLQWKKGDGVDKNKDYGRPPPEGNEKAVDQPILRAIVCTIIGILAETKDTEDEQVLHKLEHGVTSEQCVGGPKKWKIRDRYIDLTAQRRKEYLPVAVPAMVDMPIEIKTAPSAQNNFKKALEKGQSQTVGHLAKRLVHMFDFGGVGSDASAVGVSLTPLSIEVVKMKLSGVGTESVELTMVGTGCVPLLSTSLLSSDQQVVLDSSMTDGFALLAGALKYPVPQEFDSSMTSVSQVAPNNETWDKKIEYLGSGAFCSAFSRGVKEFMKIPKSALLSKSLIGEAKILRRLEGGNASIPELVYGQGDGVSTVQTIIRGEISIMKCLRLKGIVGYTLHSILRDFWKDNHARIIRAVFGALKHAHRRGIFHLDVRPGNIIVMVEGDRCGDTMLADWGCALERTKKNCMLKSFRGCPPYAHDSLLGGGFKGTALRPALDFASLAYSIDHVEAGRLRWPYEFDRPSTVGSEDLEKRRGFVTELLENKKKLPLLEDDIRDALKDAAADVVQAEPQRDE